MRRTVFLALLALASCDDDGNICIFEGRYEYGFLPLTSQCPAFSYDVPFYDDEEDCNQSGSGITPTGITFDLAVSCVPGDPVGECEGIGNLSNGCSYSVYMRRLAQ